MWFRANNFWWGGISLLIYYLRRIYNGFKLFFTQIKFRNRNKHNNCFLKNLADINKIYIWNYTWGDIDARLSDSNNSYLKIWSYCCIAWEVEFIDLSNHPLDWLFLEWSENLMVVKPLRKLLNFKRKDCVSFKAKQKIESISKIKREKTCKWPIIVDDDVRIWTWAKIMSWVHIWQWAVIAAWAIVTKDIPPYAIAWWVPAKVLKYRFPEEKIKKLLKINYSNTPIEKLGEIYEQTIKENFDIDLILKHISE